MKKFTNRRRAQIYRTIAVDMEKDSWGGGYLLCPILCRYLGLEWILLVSSNVILDSFPELKLCQPKWAIPYEWVVWWPDNDKESRIIALLFMAEICENP